VAVTARFLIDTSAAARMSNPDVGRRVSPLIQGGVVATTASLDAEALYSARGPAEYEQLWNDRRLAYEYLPTNDEQWRTALDAQRDLARTGRHREVGVHDLLTAAIAAAHNLIVVHYDSDFETAATVLTFQHVWVLPRGTVP
jgi:predicted nucleic acid-binding protein